MKQGGVTKESILVEPTSGNTGEGIAKIASALGLGGSVIVVSRKLPTYFRKELERIGFSTTKASEVDELLPLLDHNSKLLVMVPDNFCPLPNAPGGAINFAKVLTRKDSKFVMLDQYNNKSNYAFHEEHTAPLIIKRLREQFVDFDKKNFSIFISGGTFGSSLGIAKYIEANNLENIELQVCLPKGEDVFGIVNKETAGERPFFKELVKIAKRTGKINLYEIEEPNEKIVALKERYGLNYGDSSLLVTSVALEKRENDKNIFVMIYADRAYKYYEESREFNTTKLTLPHATKQAINLEEAIEKFNAGSFKAVVFVYPIALDPEIKQQIEEELEKVFRNGKLVFEENVLSDDKISEEAIKRISKLPGRLLIVCPRGRTSLRIVEALSSGKAYSLEGGLESILNRQDRPDSN